MSTLVVKTTVTDERLKDLLCSAFEGGSHYWIREVNVIDRPKQAKYFHEAPVFGGELEIIVHPEEAVKGKEKPRLTREALEKGLQIFAEKFPHHWSDFVNENDDAITGDVFLQCCVFGDAIYG